MTRSLKWSPRFAALAATAVIVFAACGGTTATTAPSAAATDAPASAAPPASEEAVHAARLAGERRGALRRGRSARRRARQVHRQLQEDLCHRLEDGRLRALQPGRGLPVEDRVHGVRRSTTPPGSSRTSTRRPRPRRSSSEVNGTGPYKLEAWNHGSDVTMVRNDRLLGRRGQDRAPDLPLEHRGRPAPASSSSPARSTASTTSARPTSRRSRATPTSSSSSAKRLNIFYVGFNNTLRAVRQREGPPGDRHGHRPPADRRQLLPARLRGRVATSRRAPSRTAAPATPWYEFDAGGGQGAAGRGRLPGWLRDRRSTTATSSAATCPTRTSSPRTSRPS